MGEGTTGIDAVDTLVMWAVVVAAVTGLCGVVWRVARPVRRVLQLVEDFIDDWRGTPARPGVPARSGVMERIDQIEDTVRTVAHEVRPNGGQSMRDAINRVDERTARISPDQD